MFDEQIYQENFDFTREVDEQVKRVVARDGDDHVRNVGDDYLTLTFRAAVINTVYL